MILDEIQQVEIINQGIDWPNIIAMFVSVFIGAGLAYITTYLLNKKQLNTQRKYDYYIGLSKDLDTLFEVLSKKNEFSLKVVMEYKPDNILENSRNIITSMYDTTYFLGILVAKQSRYKNKENEKLKSKTNDLIKLGLEYNSKCADALEHLYLGSGDVETRKKETFHMLKEARKADIYQTLIDLKEIIEIQIEKYS